MNRFAIRSTSIDSKLTFPGRSEMRPAQEASDPDPASRIIVALDVESGEEAFDIIDDCRSFGVAFKVGLQLFTNSGPAFVSRLVETGCRVFLDLKFHDIPNTVAKASVEAARLGVWMFNLHASGGIEMMRRSLDEVNEAVEREKLTRPNIIAVTVLTSSDADDLKEIGIETPVKDQVVRLSRMAKEAGLDGVVASARESVIIRQTIDDPFLIVAPGIRPGTGTIDDQKRVTTPVDALAAGADHVVIGRPITASADRAKALEHIIDSIKRPL